MMMLVAVDMMDLRCSGFMICEKLLKMKNGFGMRNYEE